MSFKTRAKGNKICVTKFDKHSELSFKGINEMHKKRRQNKRMQIKPTLNVKKNLKFNC